MVHRTEQPSGHARENVVDRQARQHAGDLVDDDERVADGAARSALLLGSPETQQAGLPEARPDVAIKGAGLVELKCPTSVEVTRENSANAAAQVASLRRVEMGLVHV